MDEVEHKLLDYFQHLAVYFATVFTIIGAIISFWWRERNAMRKRMVNVEVIAKGQDLQLKEIKKTLEQNHEEHRDIMKTMLSLHSKD